MTWPARQGGPSPFGLLAVLAGLVAAVAGCGQAAAGVEGPTWTLTELHGAPPMPGTTIDLTIADDSVSGTSGCNRFVGSATVTGTELRLAPDLAGTMMSCEDDISAQEQAFIEALQAVTSYEVAGDVLSLADADGTVVARFE